MAKNQRQERRRAAIRRLSSKDLDGRLRRLVAVGRELDVEFLLHLEEFDRREQFARLGYASLFDFCRRELGLLKCASHRRVRAVNVIREYPQAIEYLRDGRLFMTTLVILEEALTPENATRLFDEAAGKSKSEVEYLVACLKAPIVAPTARVEKMPEGAPVAAPPVVADLRAGEIAALRAASEGAASEGAASEGAASEGSAPAESSTAGECPDAGDAASAPGSGGEIASPLLVLPKARQYVEMRPVSSEQYRIKMVVPRSFVEKLEAARLALSHTVPSGEVEAVLERALEEVLVRYGKRNGTVPVRTRTPSGGTGRPAMDAEARESANEASAEKPAEPAKPAATGDSAAPTTTAAWANTAGGPIVAASAVVTDDPAPGSGGRTAGRTDSIAKVPVTGRVHIPADVWRLVWDRDGGRCSAPTADGICGSQWELEIDHVIPVACGGTTDEKNLRVRCRGHNQRAAREVFGEAFMARFGRRGSSPGRTTPHRGS